MGKAIFITGTDTSVGKTLVTGLLARYLLEKGQSVITQKWVQTGSSGFPLDIEEHLNLMGKTKEDVLAHLEYINPYSFTFPSSPHLAARKEGACISPERIIKSFETLEEEFDFVLIEGVGGVNVPLNNKVLIADIAEELKLPVLLVAENRLGAINHTLLTIEALKKRRLDMIGIVFNRTSTSQNEEVLEDNKSIIAEITKEKILGELSFTENAKDLYRNFESLGDKITNEKLDSARSQI